MTWLLRLCTDYWGMLGLIVTAIGGVFVVTGIPLLAVAMLAIGVSMLLVHYYRAGKAKRIVAEDNYVSATVTSVKVNWWTNINTSPSHYGPDDPSVIHPTVIRFAYSCDGKYYEGRSNLLWVASGYGVGQEIKLYDSAEHPEQYAL